MSQNISADEDCKFKELGLLDSVSNKPGRAGMCGGHLWTFQLILVTLSQLKMQIFLSVLKRESKVCPDFVRYKLKNIRNLIVKNCKCLGFSAAQI